MLDHYKHYFEHLAVSSIDIRHNEEDPSYFYVHDKYNPKAFDDALKNVSGTKPILLLERYVSDLDDNANKNRFQHIHGRFTIVQMAELGNQVSISAVQATTELFVKKIIAKMNSDFNVFGEIDLNGQKQKVFFSEKLIPLDPVGPMAQKYYGTTAGFEWRCPLMVKHDPGSWQ